MPKVMPSGAPAGGRLTRGRRVTTTLAEINVIPLVDVMLVLLIIFMVAAPMMQRGIEVKLPVASRSEQIASERIFISVPAAFRDDRRVFMEKEGIRLDILPERVRQLLVNRTDKQVFVRGDGSVQVQSLIEVLDALKAGGVENVGIVTRLPGEQ